MADRSTSIVRLLIVGFGLAAVLLIVMIALPESVDDGTDGGDVAAVADTTSTTSTTTTTTTTTLPPYDGWVDPASVGEPWGDTVEGLLTFRGNPTRTYYGEGPVPDSPEVLWRFPDHPVPHQVDTRPIGA